MNIKLYVLPTCQVENLLMSDLRFSTFKRNTDLSKWGQDPMTLEQLFRIMLDVQYDNS